MAVGGSKVRADVGRPLVFHNGVVRVSLQESHPAAAVAIRATLTSSSDDLPSPLARADVACHLRPKHIE